MAFLKLFLIGTFNDPNLGEKVTNLAENQKNKSWTPQSSWSPFFPGLPIHSLSHNVRLSCFFLAICFNVYFSDLQMLSQINELQKDSLDKGPDRWPHFILF